MLDYDGTLAPFVRERDKAIFYPGVAKALADIGLYVKSRLVIISGRSLEDLGPLVDGQMDKKLELWGSHGWERRKPDGSYYIWQADEVHLKGLESLKMLVHERGLAPYLEEKPRSIAIHWRGIEDETFADLRDLALNDFSMISRGHYLEMREFDGGIEARVPGRNKGDVVHFLIDESGADTLSVYIGDDRTDEDAFAAIDKRGFGILAGAEPRPSRAGYFLKVPDDLLEFFNEWKISLQGGDY